MKLYQIHSILASALLKGLNFLISEKHSLQRAGFVSALFLVKPYPQQFRALRLALCDLVALPDKAVIHLICYHAVLLVVWMLCDELPHPSGNCHQLSCGQDQVKFHSLYI